MHCHSHCSRIPRAIALDVLLLVILNSNWVKINMPLFQLLLLCNIVHWYAIEALNCCVERLVRVQSGMLRKPVQILLVKTACSLPLHFQCADFHLQRLKL